VLDLAASATTYVADFEPWDIANIADARPRWSVVIPFYNERHYLPETIRSLAAQAEPFQLILVDNASTDGSAKVAMAACHEVGIHPILLTERRPGKVAALQCGIAATRTELVATCDADTLYPVFYLTRAMALLDRPSVVAAIAATSAPAASRFKRKLSGLRLTISSKFLRQQCLNGGAGQVFRTQALMAAGSFDPSVWNWVLEDHEIMARVEREGRIAYGADFICLPSERPRTGTNLSWGLADQLRYHVSTRSNRIAFFHDYLAGRFRQRALTSDRLRRNAQNAAQHREAPGLVALHPLRR
jgi:glycosyltransferase involved in cell wall biosynthesis